MGDSAAEYLEWVFRRYHTVNEKAGVGCGERSKTVSLAKVPVRWPVKRPDGERTNSLSLPASGAGPSFILLARRPILSRVVHAIGTIHDFLRRYRHKRILFHPAEADIRRSSMARDLGS